MGYISGIINISKARKKWRKLNKHNETVMGTLFDPRFVEVGNGTYGALDVTNYSEKYKLKLGNYCSIAPQVLFVVCGDHPTNTISTYPYKSMLGLQKFEALSKGDIVVGDDVWIGARSIILSGVTIGRGAIIAAGSVVTKDVKPYSIVGGNPAKLIRMRFSEEIIERLNNLDFSKLHKDNICSHIEELYRSINSLEDIDRIADLLDL